MNSPLTTGAASKSRGLENHEGWSPGPDNIVIGKDVLELLSTSMYVDPMTIYREYVQNAADSIDDAHAQGLLTEAHGLVTITINTSARSINIRDNGTGISWPGFVSQLTALGGSMKRGTKARGFRGVGRLAGLGYCQEVIFRSRTPGENLVSELRWDCRSLQSALRSADFKGGLTQIIHDCISVRRVSENGHPERFFEVEMRGVVRHRQDRLLSATAVADYLSQVAPLPFNPAFRFAPDIVAALQGQVDLGHFHLTINGEGPIYRPHNDSFATGNQTRDNFTDLDILEIPGLDGGIAAVGWFLHHSYIGAIPTQSGIKGLRFRFANIQVGEANLLEELFPEPRFNGWSVGEIHIVDQRIIPNGRRDHFQPNVHFNNVLNHLAPTIRDIARRCRTSSIRRKWLRDFELQAAAAREKIGIIQQGTLGTKAREQQASAVRRCLATMAKICGMDDLGLDGETCLKATVAELEGDLVAAVGSNAPAIPLAYLTPAKRKLYEYLFGLIYECSANQTAAKALIDRILRKIE